MRLILAVAVCLQAVALASVPPVGALALGAKLTEAEKARKAAERKLESFEKNYDTSKDLSRKNPEKLEKDIGELDEAFKALQASDAQELGPRRDALVEKVRAAVSTAAAGKSDDEFTKHFERIQQSFDPEKKRLADLDGATVKRALDDLDRIIAKFDPAARKPYEDKRDALFAKLKTDVEAAKLGNQRGELTKEVPEVKPAAGIEAIPVMAPTWCEGADTALADLYKNFHVRNLQLEIEPTGVTQLVRAVQFSCLDPSFDVRQKWVAAFRQALSNTLGLSATTNERLLKLAAKVAMAKDEGKQQLTQTCAQFELLKSGTNEARYSRALERVGLGCPGRLIDQAEGVKMNSVDIPNGVSSQLAAAMLANRLITEGFSSDDGKLTGFAVANAVISFVPATFEQELAGWKVNEVGAINATMRFYGVVREMKALEVAAKARNASVLIDAPKKGVQAFNASLGDRQSAINVSLALEDQLKSGTLKGCAQKLYPQLEAQLKGTKVALEDLQLDGLLAYQLAFCARNDPDAPVMESVFGYWAQRSTPVRGPFTAAYLALLDAHNAGATAGPRGDFEVGKQRGAPAASGPFSPESNPIEPDEIGSFNTITPSMLPSGIVKAVEKQGELTKISFRTEHFMVPVLNCVETNKIDRIASDGTILYRSSCTKVGEKPAESTNEPISVPSYAANGISAGNLLLYTGAPVNDDIKGKPHRGFVVEAWDSPARKKRTSLFGFVP